MLAIFKMAAKVAEGQVNDGTISKFSRIGMMYFDAKFHAFNTKCTIFS